MKKKHLPNSTKAEEDRPSFWASGVLAELFASHPILTVFLTIGFLGGAVFGAMQGLAASSIMWFALGAMIGAVGGMILILLLWVGLMVIGFAG